MIDLRDINETIDKIKRSGTTFQDAQRLSVLYIVRDYMLKDEGNAENVKSREADKYEEIPERIWMDGGSEFIQACRGARVEDALKVLDEHMEAVRVLYPKEYSAVVRRLEDAKV